MEDCSVAIDALFQAQGEAIAAYAAESDDELTLRCGQRVFLLFDDVHALGGWIDVCAYASDDDARAVCGGSAPQGRPRRGLVPRAFVRFDELRGLGAHAFGATTTATAAAGGGGGGGGGGGDGDAAAAPSLSLDTSNALAGLALCAGDETLAGVAEAVAARDDAAAAAAAARASGAEAGHSPSGGKRKKIGLLQNVRSKLVSRRYSNSESGASTRSQRSPSAVHEADAAAAGGGGGGGGGGVGSPVRVSARADDGGSEQSGSAPSSRRGTSTTSSASGGGGGGGGGDGGDGGGAAQASSGLARESSTVYGTLDAVDDVAKSYDDNSSIEANNSNTDSPYFKPTAPKANGSGAGGAESPRSRKRRKRAMVLQEILSTERIYVKDLHFICEEYLTPLRAKKLLNEKYLGDMFRNVESLLGFHTVLLGTIESTCGTSFEEMTYETEIGDVFIKLAQYMRVYAAYCVGQEHGRAVVIKLQETKPAFAKFCHETLCKPASRGLDILAFLIKPVQRICKYPLLIRQLLDETDSSHPDSDALRRAFDDLTAVADHVNEQKRMATSIRRIAELDKSLSSLPKTFQLALPTRRFIYERKLTRVAGGARSVLTVFLFNDVLIYAKHNKTASKFTYKGHVPLDTESTFVEEVSEAIEPFAFQIIRADCANHIFSAASEEDKTEWLRNLSPLVAGCQTLAGEDFVFDDDTIAAMGAGASASVLDGKLDKMQELLLGAQ